jgi:TAG lipase/steryl ester hydrolase/phospholipase A2/LPA acyltransferase
MYHMGVVRCCLEQGCLPSVISGTSGGSIVAAFVAIHTEEECLQILNNKVSNLHAPLRWFEPVLKQIVHFAKHGLLMDQKKFAQICKAYFGDWTFEEAYRRTGRIVNICVSPSSGGRGVSSSSVLLNHLTTPQVFIWSAVVTSCSLPGLMPPVELMSKASDGSTHSYLPNTKFIDGSLKADIPIARLAELFNTTRYVVSQVNPHVVPFARSSGESNEGFLARVAAHVHLDLREQCRKLAKLNLIPLIFGEPFAAVFTQKYHGDVTIVPDMSLIDSLKAISHPSKYDMTKYLGVGQRATWTHVPRLQSLQSIERVVEDTYAALLQQTHGSKISVDDDTVPLALVPRIAPPANKQHFFGNHAIDSAQVTEPIMVCQCCLDRHKSLDQLIDLRDEIERRRALQKM